MKSIAFILLFFIQMIFVLNKASVASEKTENTSRMKSKSRKVNLVIVY